MRGRRIIRKESQNRTIVRSCRVCNTRYLGNTVQRNGNKAGRASRNKYVIDYATGKTGNCAGARKQTDIATKGIQSGV